VNLALKDIRFGLTRFALTIVGVSLLMAATIGMLGMYRGIVQEALVIIDGIGADVWVAEGGRSGPFAEPSSIPANMDRRVAGVEGVASARRFTNFNQQYTINGRPTRLAITGIDFPADTGDWIPLIAGRSFQAQHYEAIADHSSGLVVGDVIRLRYNDFTVVGVSRGQVDMGGDSMLFLTVPDAQEAGYMLPSEAVLLNRQAKGRSRMGMQDSSGLSAVAVRLQPGVDAETVRDKIASWGDVTVLTREEQQKLLLDGRLGKLRIQILAFTVMILLICCAVISLTIYTMTVEKSPQIALLKLLGARDRMIAGMISYQSFVIGLASFVLGTIISLSVFPHFPRTVLILPTDLAWLGASLLSLSLVASWFAIRKSLSIRAQEVLS
jgi:putative ABC transport system permease protein